MALTGPPVVPRVEKWLGLGIGMPSNRHNRPVGELPLITMSLRESLAAATPAKLPAKRATSLRPPEKRLTSSTLKERALTLAMSLLALSLLTAAEMTTSSILTTASSKLRSSTTSLPAETSTLGTVMLLYPR